MASIKDVIDNIEQIYGSNNSLNLLKDFERVFDELDLYVYDNWMDGELASGPKEDRYFIECTFMWPKDKMPEPEGGKRLLEYGCKVGYAETAMARVRKIESPDDIRPGTRKGKIDYDQVWMVKVKMPKRLMKNIDRGYNNLDKNKVRDMLTQGGVVASQPEPVEETPQGTANEEL
jgi:hypothetical protein